jgi:hypothetical protein
MMNETDLNKILELHKLWLDGHADGKRANFREADLRWVNLSGADLRKTNLGGVNLYEANLRGANLFRANLRRADLSFCEGVITFQGSKHFAFAFEFKDIKYIKIGCLTKTVDEWLESFEVEGNSHEYSRHEINLYVSFVRFIQSVPFNKD